MTDTKKSLGITKEIHGITVKKLPVGAYIKAMEAIGELPAVMLEKLYPGKSADIALRQIHMLDREDTLNLVCKALTLLPNEFIKYVSKLLSCSPDVLLSLSPDELLDVLIEFWEVNRLENFISKAKVLVIKVR